jgi:hypothetical protein
MSTPTDIAADRIARAVEKETGLHMEGSLRVARAAIAYCQSAGLVISKGADEPVAAPPAASSADPLDTFLQRKFAEIYQAGKSPKHDPRAVEWAVLTTRAQIEHELLRRQGGTHG